MIILNDATIKYEAKHQMQDKTLIDSSHLCTEFEIQRRL
jgi:hypothetical protein